MPDIRALFLCTVCVAGVSFAQECPMTPGDDADIALARHAAGLYEPRNNFGNDWHLGDIRIKWHIFLTPSGDPVIDPEDLKPLIPLMNALYSDIGVGFCPDEEIDYIETPADWWPSVPAEDIDSLMVLNDVEGAMDVYWANDLGGGIIGKSSFTWYERDSIVLDASALSSERLRRATFGHEIGHWFDLYHTHDSSMGEECVNGSNCEFAGDLLCDTAAAFNMNGCITSNCNLLTSCQDNEGPCSGDGFYDPDTRNYMGYQSPNRWCRNRLSLGQYERARGALENFRMDYIVPSCPTILGDETCEGISTSISEGRHRIAGDAYPFGSGPRIVTPELNDDWLLGNQWFGVVCDTPGVLTISTEGHYSAIAVYPFSLTCPTAEDQIVASTARHDGLIGAQVHLQVAVDDVYLIRVGIPDDGFGYEDFWLDLNIEQFTTQIAPDYNLVDACEALPEGSILKLMPGTHVLQSPLVLSGKNLTLVGERSETEPSVVQIPDGMPGVMLVENDFRTRILDLRFERVGQGKNVPGNIMLVNTDDSMDVGGGPLFHGCTFSGSTNAQGGNIRIIESEPIFSQCSFIGQGSVLGGNVAVEGNLVNSAEPCFMFCSFSGTAERGGAIHIGEGAEAWLYACDFNGCTALQDGGAIYAMDNVELYECQFATEASNSAAGNGGAIAGENCFIEIVGCTFGTLLTENNTASVRGGAIAISGPGAALGLSQSTLIGNWANEGSGVAVLNEANVALWQVEFQANGTWETSQGGGLFIEGAHSTIYQFDECNFDGNIASRGGGAFLGPGISLSRIDDSIFQYNSGAMGIFEGSGGGLYIDGVKGASGIELRDTRFELNSASTQGGALYVNAVDLSIDGCEFDGNQAEDAKAMFVEGTSTVLCIGSSIINHATVDYPDEASLFAVQSDSLVDFDGDLLCGNGPILKSGQGAIQIQSSVCEMAFCDLDQDDILDCEDDRIEYVPSGLPGAVAHAIKESELGTTFTFEAGQYVGSLPSYDVISGDVRDCVFQGAVDADGQPATIFDGENASGVGLISQNASETTIFRNIIFQGGRSSQGAGLLVLFTSGSGPRFENCLFRDNEAINEQGEGIGGGVLIPLGEASFDSCVFQFNRAGLSGGAFALGTNATAVLTNCTVELNEAAEGGGASVNQGADLVLISSTFCDNTVDQIAGDYTADKASCVANVCDPGCSEGCIADIDEDGLVDGSDLGLMIAAFGVCTGCPEDLNGNGSVDGDDLGMLLGEWGLCQ